jgi:hypothetical protein
MAVSRVILASQRRWRVSISRARSKASWAVSAMPRSQNFEDTEPYLMDWINFSESCDRIRAALVSGAIKAVCIDNTQLYPIPKLSWTKDNTWYRLIVDGKFYHTQTNQPEAKPVFFEKESVDKVCAEFIELRNNQEFRNMLNSIDLDKPSPALKLLFHAIKDESVLESIQKNNKPRQAIKADLQNLAKKLKIEQLTHKDFLARRTQKGFDAETIVTDKHIDAISTILAPTKAQIGKI